MSQMICAAGQNIQIRINLVIIYRCRKFLVLAHYLFIDFKTIYDIINFRRKRRPRKADHSWIQWMGSSAVKKYQVDCRTHSNLAGDDGDVKVFPVYSSILCQKVLATRGTRFSTKRDRSRLSSIMVIVGEEFKVVDEFIYVGPLVTESPNTPVMRLEGVSSVVSRL